MTETKIRISPDLYDQLKRIAEKRGVSIREVAEEAIRAYLYGTQGIEKPVKKIRDGVITLQYSTRCSRCKRELRAGDLAYWSRTEFEDGTSVTRILCMECYYSTSAFKEYYLEKLRLERLLRELRKEARELGERVLELRSQYKSLRIISEIEGLIREVRDDYRDAIEHFPEDEAVEKLDTLISKLESLLERIEAPVVEYAENRNVSRNIQRRRG